jgi:hypothetical protein
MGHLGSERAGTCGSIYALDGAAALKTHRTSKPNAMADISMMCESSSVSPLSLAVACELETSCPIGISSAVNRKESLSDQSVPTT